MNKSFLPSTIGSLLCHLYITTGRLQVGYLDMLFLSCTGMQARRFPYPLVSLLLLGNLGLGGLQQVPNVASACCLLAHWRPDPASQNCSDTQSVSVRRNDSMVFARKLRIECTSSNSRGIRIGTKIVRLWVKRHLPGDAFTDWRETG